MKCEKCLKKRKEIFMKPDIQNKRYICPECNNVINWVTNKSENE